MCRLTFLHLLPVVPTLSALTSATQSPPVCFESFCYRPPDVIRRDVAIIGGGSSGTYAAIALKDLGQSIVVVEQSSRLGGHFDWYSTPTSAEPIQYGVQVLWNTSVVRDLFARLNVSQQSLPAEQPPDVYYDFTTGTRVENVSSMPGLSGVVEQVYRFPGLRFSTQLQHPVPSDLLMPFGQFVERHGLEDEAFGVYSNPITDGLVDILNQSTLNAFRALNPAALAEGTGQALVGDYSQLFTRATSELGTNVIFNSTVMATHRPSNSSGVTGVRLAIQSSAGVKLIEASQVLVAIPQTPENMEPFGLDLTEEQVFSQVEYSALYTGLVNASCLQAATYIHVDPTAKYGIPTGPGLTRFAPTMTEGIYSFLYQSTSPMERAAVDESVIATIQRLANATDHELPRVLAFADHTPFNLYVSSASVREGFYDSLNALQGHRCTWYTGGLFNLGSPSLWIFTKSLLSQVIAAKTI